MGFRNGTAALNGLNSKEACYDRGGTFWLKHSNQDQRLRINTTVECVDSCCIRWVLTATVLMVLSISGIQMGVSLVKF